MNCGGPRCRCMSTIRQWYMRFKKRSCQKMQISMRHWYKLFSLHRQHGFWLTVTCGTDGGEWKSRRHKKPFAWHDCAANGGAVSADFGKFWGHFDVDLMAITESAHPVTIGSKQTRQRFPFYSRHNGKTLSRSGRSFLAQDVSKKPRASEQAFECCFPPACDGRALSSTFTRMQSKGRGDRARCVSLLVPYGSKRHCANRCLSPAEERAACVCRRITKRVSDPSYTRGGLCERGSWIKEEACKVYMPAALWARVLISNAS